MPCGISKPNTGRMPASPHKTMVNSMVETIELSMPRKKVMVETMKSCASIWIRWSMLSGASRRIWRR